MLSQRSNPDEFLQPRRVPVTLQRHFLTSKLDMRTARIKAAFNKAHNTCGLVRPDNKSHLATDGAAMNGSKNPFPEGLITLLYSLRTTISRFHCRDFQGMAGKIRGLAERGVGAQSLRSLRSVVQDRGCLVGNTIGLCRLCHGRQQHDLASQAFRTQAYGSRTRLAMEEIT